MSGLARALRELDERGLPPLASWLLRVAAGLQHTAAGLQHTAERLRGQVANLRAVRARPAARTPRGGPRSARYALARLDDRFAGAGPFAVLRDLPQVGFIVIAMLLLAGAAGSAVDHASSQPALPPAIVPGLAPSPVAPESCGLAHAVEGTAYVGPTPGAPIAGYLATRTALLLRCALDHPGQRALAVVSLDAPVTPAGAAGVFGSLPLARVYLQVPGHPARSYDVTGTAPQAVTSAADATAGQLLADAALQQEQADTVTGTDPTEAQGKAFLLMIARQERAEAAALRGGCACLYGAVVTASLRRLGYLAGAGPVRLVDLAPLGTTLAAGTLLPLLPADTGIATPEPVPAPFTAGGP